MNKGFTLVELSIVLVIIGLLIGGILVAQSMIETARIQGYIRSLQQYEVAVTNFYNNYHQQPGDSSFFVPPGDNNRTHDSMPGCVSENSRVVPGVYSGSERNQVWAHLSQSNMIKGGYVAYSPANNCGGTHSDSELYEKIMPAFLKSGSGGYSGESLVIEYILNPSYQRYYSFPLFAVPAIAVDIKIDDGGSLSGNFIARTSGYDRCDDYFRTTGNQKVICWSSWYPEGNAPTYF